MSLFTSSATDSSSAGAASGTSAGRPLNYREQRDQAAAADAAANPPPGTTVSLSTRALDFLESAGKDVVDGVETAAEDVGKVIAWPFGVAKDAIGSAVDEVEQLAGEGWHALSSGVQSVVSTAESAAHAVFVDVPSTIATEVGSVAKTALTGVSTVAGGALQVAAASGTNGAQLLGALL